MVPESDFCFPFRRIKYVYIIGILLLAVACGSSYNPESRLVDVGGHRLNIRCSGEGSPAVILGSGLASSNHDWGLVEERVSEFTQVCSYDRAGLGGSVLDGLIRMDLSHGLKGPAKEFRIDFYLDALL